MKTTTKQETINGITYTLRLTPLNEGSQWLQELYTPSEHIAGETIAVPHDLRSRGCPEHYRGQYTPAELAKDFAKQGSENPSKEAYQSLQDELRHYIEADTACFEVFATKAGVELAHTYGVFFDYSHNEGYTIEEQAPFLIRNYWDEYRDECRKEAEEALAALCEAD